MRTTEFADCGLTFQQFFGMTPEEKAAYEKEHPFTYRSMEEYIDDVIEWLRLSDWHYSETSARSLIIERYDWVAECFSKHAPVDLCGAEAGYCCG